MKEDNYENSKMAYSDEAGTIYKIVYQIGYQTRIMQARAASPFLAFKEFKRKMLPIQFESCLVDSIEEKVVPLRRNYKRDKFKHETIATAIWNLYLLILLF